MDKSDIGTLLEKRPADWYQGIEDGIEQIGVSGFLHALVEKLMEKADRISPEVEVDEDSPLWPQVEKAAELRSAAEEIEAIAVNLS